MFIFGSGVLLLLEDCGRHGIFLLAEPRGFLHLGATHPRRHDLLRIRGRKGESEAEGEQRDKDGKECRMMEVMNSGVTFVSWFGVFFGLVGFVGICNLC